MVAWSEYKSAARARGALALELYVAESIPAGDGEAVRNTLPDHLAYQRSLEEAGSLVFAGPLSDSSGEAMEGVGLIVYRALSLAEARRLAEADPMHKAGARRFTLRRWLVNEGALTLKVGLSTGTVKLS